MKKLNYFMSVLFGVLGLICIIVAVLYAKYEMLFLAGICIILYVVAWQDYRNELNKE